MRFAILGAEGRVRSDQHGLWQVRVGIRVRTDGVCALWETGAGWGEPLDELTGVFLRDDALRVLGSVLHDLGIHGATGEIPGALTVTWTGEDERAHAWLARNGPLDRRCRTRTCGLFLVREAL